jgi:hypothetical protein
MIFRVFHGNQVFCWHKFFAKLPEPLSFAQPFAKVVQTFRGNWISLRERLTGKTMFYSVFAKVLKLLICIFPPRGCRFFVFLCLLPFLKKHRKQRLGSGDKNCVVSHQWTQVHLPIYLQNNITNNSGSQKNVTHTIHVISAPTKNLIWLKTILNLLCVFRHLLLRAKLPEPDRDQAERVWCIAVSKLPTSGSDQNHCANEAGEKCIFMDLFKPSSW